MTDTVEPKPTNSKEVDKEMVKNLSLGLTSIYQPTLKALQAQLLEITKKQEFLNDELHSENLRLSKTIYSDEFQKMFVKIKLYRDKLSLIKRNMMVIHEQSTKLKPTLKALQAQLLEITKKQEFLNDELHSENLRLSKTIYSDEFQKMFVKIKLYRDKLSLIKRNMMVIHEQSTKLKKRALKLEEQKQKEALERIQKREYEELLISKPST